MDNLGSFTGGPRKKSDLYSWTLEEMTATQSAQPWKGARKQPDGVGLNKQESTSSARSQATISIYKSIVFLYASNEKSQNKIKKTIPFTLVPKELIT